MQNKLKIAYIIQCHKNANQINMLTRQLTEDNLENDIYIHLDKKSNHIRSEINTNNRIKLVPYDSSISVKWGHFSQCLATLSLLNEVRLSGVNYDFVWLLSGQDFPIKSNLEINDYLYMFKNELFIEIIEKENVIKQFQKRIDLFYPEWMISRNFFRNNIRRCYLLATGGKKNTFSIFKRRLPLKRFYHGSSWWCLPYQCVLEMIAFIEKNEEINNFYKNVMNPDESYFQTIAMQTSYFKVKKHKITTYIDWQENKSSPKTFKADDIENLVQNNNLANYCFIRKIDLDTDENIIEKIKTEILSK